MERIDRINRLLLLLLGLLLVAGGIAGLLVGFGVFGQSLRVQPVLHNGVGAFFGRHGQWLWPALAAAAFFLILPAGLWWLRGQFSTAGVRTLDLEPSTKQGSTELSSAALIDALTEELASYRGVDRAAARLTGDSRSPEMRLTLYLTDRADLAAVRSRVEDEAVAHACAVLDLAELPIRLDLKVTAKATRLTD